MKFKNFFLLWICIFLILLPGCKTGENISKKVKTTFHEIKEDIVERTKLGLSKIPFIKKYIHLPPPPEKLYLSTETLIEKLKEYNADSIFPEEFKKVNYVWKTAQELYKSKFYVKAKRKLEETKALAEKLLKKLKSYKENLRKKALQKFEKIKKKAEEYLKHHKKDALKIKFYLWKLKELINLENYEQFKKELKNPPF